MLGRIGGAFESQKRDDHVPQTNQFIDGSANDAISKSLITSRLSLCIRFVARPLQ
jgi:hypothetical protein